MSNPLGLMVAVIGVLCAGAAAVACVWADPTHASTLTRAVLALTSLTGVLLMTQWLPGGQPDQPVS